MKHIIFFVSSMQGGGAERVAALLCNYWVGQGHRVTLMPTFSGRGECLYPLDAKVGLDYLADRVGSRSKSLVNRLRRFYALRKAIREHAPDVILSFLPPVNVAVVLASRGLGVPVVVAERTYPPAMPLGAVLERLRRWTYPQAKGVVMQTERGREWLASCCPSVQGYVIPNPVVYPLPLAAPMIAPPAVVKGGHRLLVAAGRLGPEKGFESLVLAFSFLADRYSDWDLVILGDGIERPKLEQQRQAHGLVGRLHLPGRVGNLADWYRRGELYVMSSRFEGFPNTLMEAMAHGLPVVSFDCDTGPRDIIRHGVDGLLVPPDKGDQGLTKAMEALMVNDVQRQRMGEEAKKVRERFSMARIGAQWDEVLGLNKPAGTVRSTQ